jgi:chromosomal replication initiator protein
VPVETPASKEQTSPSSATARRISRQLASRIGPHKFDMWFGNAKLQVDGRRVEVATDSSFVAKWIDAHFSDDLKGVATEALGPEALIDVRVAPDMFGRDDRPEAARHVANSDAIGPRSDRAPAEHRRRHVRIERDRRPAARRRPSLRRLDEFVVGQANRLAYSAACRLSEEQDPLGVSPLFIHGECGLGKTHLLQGICHRFLSHAGRNLSVRYVTGEQFTNEYIASIRNNTIDDFRKRIRKLDLLAIDDVHFLSNKVRTQSEFLHTLDAIDLTGSRVVLASDEHPRLIKKFSQALISRFLSGMVVQIGRPDRETRIAIVRRLAQVRNLPMHEAAMEAVAARCVGSVRELEGAVTKLAALHSVAGEMAGECPDAAPPAGDKVGLVLVEQLFKDRGWQPPTPVRMGTVIDVICHRLGVGRADLMGSSRHRRMVLGRALVAYLGREMTTHSYPEIARALGRSYHSTIHTAEQRLRRQMKENQMVEAGQAERQLPLRELVDQLRHEIRRATVRS